MSRRPVRSLLLALGLVLGLVGAPQVVRADGVSDAQRALQQAQDELDNLVNQMGQLDEDYGAAQDRMDALDKEIADSQAKVDAMTAELGSVQAVLTDLAVTRFTSGGSSALSPLFSDAAAYSLAEQKDALGRVALDTGATTTDDLQSVVRALDKEQKSLQRKKDEQAQLIATLEQKQAQYNDLEKVYQTKLADAQARFGAAKLQAEEDRRAAAAAAAAAAQAPRAGSGNTGNNGSTGNGGGAASPGRGGGNAGGNGGGSSGGSGGGSTPPVPPVSGKAGVAIAAAYSQIGVPYRFAAESPGVAFDCSGLTKWAWGRAGVYLPHQSGAQYGTVPHVPKDQAQPGDLIFYYSPIGHVGIYVGGGQMIHAPATGKTVTLVTVNWGKVVGVGRPG